jgi:hypothetical protein
MHLRTAVYTTIPANWWYSTARSALDMTVVHTQPSREHAVRPSLFFTITAVMHQSRLLAADRDRRRMGTNSCRELSATGSFSVFFDGFMC